MKRITDYFNDEAADHDEIFINKMGMSEFYDQIGNLINRYGRRDEILILGCGTGLEIERIKFETNVTAIDISNEMLNQLNKKRFFKHINLNTICASILDYDFGKEKYDIVLTCYTLHHFNITQKQDIFRRIYYCLKKDGIFINGDTMLKTLDEETYRMKEAETIYLSENMPFASLHIDVPLTIEHETQLLKEADFQNIKLEKEWQKTNLYTCVK